MAIVTPAWPQGSLANGIVNYVAKMRPALMRHIDLHLLAFHVEEGSQAPGIVDLQALTNTHGIRPLLARIARRIAPDVVQARSMGGLVAAGVHYLNRQGPLDVLQLEESFGMAWWVRRWIKTPVIVRLHGPWFLNGAAAGAPDDHTFRHRVHAEGRAIAAADGITAPSREVLEQTRRRYGLALNKAEVIPNPRPDIPPEARWKASACEQGTLLFVGRFDRHKGGDVMIDAFARVLDRHPDARLVFVGPDRGLVDDAGHQWSIQEYSGVRLPGAAESGRFAWLGEMPYNALFEQRRRACATIVCSRWENFANTATEAFAMGCPLVMSNTGGLPEIVQDGHNGLLCRPGDAVDLAEKLCTLIEEPALAERLGRQAAEDSEARYNPEDLAERTAAFYERIALGA